MKRTKHGVADRFTIGHHTVPMRSDI